MVGRRRGQEDPPVRYEGSGKFPAEGLFDTVYQWDVRCTWEDGLVLHFMDDNTYHKFQTRRIPRCRGAGANGADITKMPNGAVFVGTEGWVIVAYEKVVTHPASLMDSVIGPNEIHLPDSALAQHSRRYADRIPADADGGASSELDPGDPHRLAGADDIESAVRSDLVSQLSELCIRTGQPVRWDPQKETILGNEAARKMISRPMRAPWGVS